MAKFSLRQYAKDGARARAVELEAELKKIYSTFPELAGSGARGTSGRTGRASRRRRKVMTAAQRKAVSVRMRKYWAARRKAKS